jgi:pSer/pThr/pTyr-binding forkhead associated (FHA) protein
LEVEETRLNLRNITPTAHYGPLTGSLRAWLEVKSGPDSGGRFEIHKVPCIVGRGKHADIRLKDEILSRLHLIIGWEEDEFRVIDNQSQNGTRLNGSKVKEYKIQNGDTLLIGHTTLVFRTEGEATPSDRTS